MKTVTRLTLAASALAVAGCANLTDELPGSSLGSTFSAARYLNADHGGSGFNGALASEYTELGRRSAFNDSRWHNATAYMSKAQQAEAGSSPAPWTPDQLGVGGDAASEYDSVVATINANKADRPEACARAQAMWDQYLEALRAEKNGVPQGHACISVADARAALDEALAACAGGAGPSDFVVYFGFNSTNLSDLARETLDDVVAAVSAMSATALSVVGHADTVGSVQYNQGLSERRARRVAGALESRGISADAMTLAGRSENQLAVQTADNVREPLNRRVEISLSK